jgi:hypothetical protein
VEEEFRQVNAMLGLPSLQIVDYRRTPRELPQGDPLQARVQMAIASRRREALAQEQPNMSEEDMQTYEAMLAGDFQDPSPLTSQDVGAYIGSP